MRGILVLSHGSQDKSMEHTLQEIVKRLRELCNADIIEAAYLKFSRPDLKDGLDRLKDKGVTDMVVIPYFLFDGVHVKEDIPRAIESYLQENGGIRITVGKSLGADPRLAAILADRIREVR